MALLIAAAAQHAGRYRPPGQMARHKKERSSGPTRCKAPGTVVWSCCWVQIKLWASVTALIHSAWRRCRLSFRAWSLQPCCTPRLGCDIHKCRNCVGSNYLVATKKHGKGGRERRNWVRYACVAVLCAVSVLLAAVQGMWVCRYNPKLQQSLEESVAEQARHTGPAACMSFDAVVGRVCCVTSDSDWFLRLQFVTGLPDRLRICSKRKGKEAEVLRRLRASGKDRRV